MTSPSPAIPHYKLIVVGAGAAGIPAAIFAAEQGARVLLVEADLRVGGTFLLSSGQMSAAGTRLQAAKGIVDDADAHFEDVMRISHGRADPALVRLAVDNAADTLHWLLDGGLEVLPDHPIIYPGHEPYRTPRTCWGPDKGRSVLKILAGQLERAMADRRLDLALETRLVGIITDDDGRATGVTLVGPEGERRVAADAVMLATGGFTTNRALSREMAGGIASYPGGNPLCQGDGLHAATAVGATVINKGMYLPIFAAVEDARSPGGYLVSTQTNPLWRLPWEIAVGEDGGRFYAEDELSCDIRERALLGQPELRYWLVWDAAIRRAAPPLFMDPSLEAEFGCNPNYIVADNIVDLAGQTGVDAAILQQTIADYNVALANRSPDPFGRIHRPLPIVEAPFYAVRHHGWSITSFAGLQVDSQLRVVTADGQPIPGLYAAGEIIGFGQTSGDAFASGMSVTPAMTFGRLLGERLGAHSTTVAKD